jgi:hypothetical protein
METNWKLKDFGKDPGRMVPSNLTLRKKKPITPTKSTISPSTENITKPLPLVPLTHLLKERQFCSKPVPHLLVKTLLPCTPKPYL